MKNEFNLDWDEWLKKVHVFLTINGYKKYQQTHKNNDFAYYKSFSKDDIKIYQIGLLFYDFRKYINKNPDGNRISILYECSILDGSGRMDLCVSNADMDLGLFELMSDTFYKSMKKFN